MRATRVRLRGGDGFAVTGLVAAPFVTLMAWLATRWPDRWVPDCALKSLTGLPCPTCGAFRAAEAWRSGNWLQALRLQPLLVCAAAGLWVLFAFTLIALLTCRWRPALTLSRAESRRLWLAGGGLVLLQWAFLLWDGR